MKIALLKPALLYFVLPLLLNACTATPEKTAVVAPEAVAAPQTVNDFPTQDRVEYVLECIAKKGGLKYETLYPCICKVDKIAEKMRYHEYAEAKTFTYMRKTPGDQGGIFRDPPQAKELRNKLKEAEQYGDAQCFVKKPQ
ncbi:MAG: hypothetical protein ACU837_03500 [Gammaproteobacteria bacterium]